VLDVRELRWRFFGKDVGEFGNNDDVTFFSAAPAEGAGEADSFLAE
jgi:hypothetical protein